MINNLAVKNPKLAKQWHPTKNGELTPNDVTISSGKKVWWQCKKGHEWQAIIASRANGNGCPFCSGRYASADNCLQTLNPKLAKQWHLTKNANLTPNEVTTGSSKKVWWQCKKGHEWQAGISSRTNGNGCPYCSGRYASADNCLQTLNPELAKQWHTTKNGELTPNDVTISSGKKVWWKCKKGHEWQASIAHRSNGKNCPFCSGKRVCVDNSLHTFDQELSKQWHPTKNGDLTSNDVTAGSSKKVWWQCKKGHEWQGRISHRANGIGCPVCSQGKRTSFPEQALYYYLKSAFNDTLNRHKYNNKWEIDVFVPSLKFGIEYDGIYYHKEKTSDAKKDKYLISEGICLLRVKEKGENILKYYRKNKIIYCNNAPSDHQLNEIIKTCFDYISENITHKKYLVNINVKEDRPKIYDLYLKGEEESSLHILYPEISKQWHPTKNLSIKPNMVRAGSNKKVWWQCEKGHEWQAIIGSRAKGIGCPFCSGLYASADNCLQTLNPKLVKQWHPTKKRRFTSHWCYSRLQ